jgi:hypothetical protein
MEVELGKQPWQVLPPRRQSAGPCRRSEVHSTQDGEQNVIGQRAEPIFLPCLLQKDKMIKNTALP